MDDHGAGKERPGAAERPQDSGAAAPGRGGRMSRQRKTAAVLRLLRGEDLETVSRSLGVTAATLTLWRDAFLAAGEAALTTRPDSGEALENDRLKAKLGEVWPPGSRASPRCRRWPVPRPPPVRPARAPACPTTPRPKKPARAV